MIALDTNILVHAHRMDSPFHQQADVAMHQLAETGEPWALPWPCIAEFACVVTSPKQFNTPSTTEEVSEQVRAWRDVPSCRLLTETGLTEETFFKLLDHPDVYGARVYDARIAAICLDHGVRELWTADRDYARFPKLRTRNPLEEQ